MPGRKRIGILMHMTAGYLMDVFKSITTSTETHTRWNIRVAGLFDSCDSRLYAWKPHGVLTCHVTKELKRLHFECDVPVVSFTSSYPDSNLPTVHTDDVMVGRMAAEFFLNMNLQHFAYWPGHTAPFATSRKEGFISTLLGNAVNPKCIHTLSIDQNARWQKRDKTLSQWLRKLPKPIGVFVSQDAQAYYIAGIARETGIDVPNEIALLGVDNDPLVCNITDPPLSSVIMPAPQVGIVAAQMLEKLLNGEKLDSELVKLQPIGIFERGSTDMLAIQDKDMAKAVRFIRQKATSGITVSDVLKNIAISRRSFESRFRQLFGRSPGNEISRVQLDHVKHLLLDTDKSMPDIARECGFCDPEYMSRIFKKHNSLPPSKYRKQHRNL